MPNIKLTIEYDGSAFCGWQEQPEQRSIEAELKRAISTVLREDIRVVYASGRTDAGVHAKGQVVNFFCSASPDLFRLRIGVSSVLRDELSVLSAEIMPDDFHARHSAVSKCYSYTILNRDTPAVLERGRVWFVPEKLNLELMHQAASELVGLHDFSSFQATACQAKSAEKNIFESGFQVQGELLIYRVVGSGFLKQMVRSIVGSLVDMGRGVLDAESMTKIIEAKDRRRAGMTAPAHALCLEWVRY